MRTLTAQGSHYISYKRNQGYCLVLFLPLKTQLALFLAATSISCLTACTRRFCSSVMPSLPSKSVRLKRDAGKDIKGTMRSLPWNYESFLLAGTVPGLCCVSCQEGGDFVMEPALRGPLSVHRPNTKWENQCNQTVSKMWEQQLCCGCFLSLCTSRYAVSPKLLFDLFRDTCMRRIYR